MPFLFFDINKTPANQHPLYFLDSNVWICVLRPSLTHQYRQAYVDFFDDLIVAGTSKIVITNLLLSEIINAYLRQVAMEVFFQSRGENPRAKNYKWDYREGVGKSDFRRQLNKICNDLLSFQSYFEFLEDDFVKIDPLKLLTDFQKQNADYNDYYYYKLCLQHNIPIVTDDGDFVFPDLEIITANNKLLKIKS